MRRTFLTLALAFAAPLHAQGLMADFHADVRQVQQKLIALAKAMPENTYSWHPNGARSVGELFMHVAEDNYFIPVAMGKPAPASTGITEDYKSTAAYTGKQRTKEQIIAELEASFTHLHEAMGLTTDENRLEKLKVFGQEFTRQRLMILTVTHLHEHLGQAIAYARSNNVVPPWSK
ncbi:MAG TPA: DinB family protein [Gemmatimonadaceae bacterium]|jgi:uncharacterized damage-inducible protein DinB